MLNEQTMEKLYALKLLGMAEPLKNNSNSHPSTTSLLPTASACWSIASGLLKKIAG